MRWVSKDNSGIKVATQLKIKKSKQKWACPADLLTIFPQKFKYVKLVKRQKYLGLVVSSKRIFFRRYYYIKGFTNGLIVLNKDEKFLGSKIFGPVFKELKEKRLGSYKYKRVYARIGGRFI